MAGYIMLDLEITDPECFQEYLKLAGPTVKQYGLLKATASIRRQVLR